MLRRGTLKFGLLWPLLIAWVALAARLVPTPRTIDDAFITFRYARNVVTGRDSSTTPVSGYSEQPRRCMPCCWQPWLGQLVFQIIPTWRGCSTPLPTP